jgi:RES domain-containing protein
VTLWRATNHASLDGTGGLRASGRWHHRGKRIVYCAPNPATALLEILVHAEIDIQDIPVTIRCLEIEAPDSIAVESLDASGAGAAWQQEKSRQVGDDWLSSKRTALLRVPSVVVPATWNVLINPAHSESRHLRIVRTHRHPFDRRLLK